MKKYIITIVLIVSISYILRANSKGNIKIKNIINQLPSNGEWPYRSLSNVEDITIHHSAGNVNKTALDHANHHVNNKGWVGIGYHYEIDIYGNVHQTNKLTSNSYHNGYNNTKSIGICLTGNFDNIQPSSAQLSALISLIKYLKRNRNLNNLMYLMGHKEYKKATRCPGSNINLDNLRRKTGLSFRSTPENRSNNLLRPVNFGLNIVPYNADN